MSVGRDVCDVRQSDVVMAGSRSEIKKFHVSCVSQNTVLYLWRAHPYTYCHVFCGAIDRHGAQHACSAVTARKMPCVEMLKLKMHLGIFPCQPFLSDL